MENLNAVEWEYRIKNLNAVDRILNNISFQLATLATIKPLLNCEQVADIDDNLNNIVKEYS